MKYCPAIKKERTIDAYKNKDGSQLWVREAPPTPNHPKKQLLQ